MSQWLLCLIRRKGKQRPGFKKEGAEEEDRSELQWGGLPASPTPSLSAYVRSGGKAWKLEETIVIFNTLENISTCSGSNGDLPKVVPHPNPWIL